MKSPAAGKMPDFGQAEARERIHENIRYRSDGDAWRLGGALDHIAALEATVARLTKPVSDEEVEDACDNLPVPPDRDDMGRALTAFLERRMKG